MSFSERVKENKAGDKSKRRRGLTNRTERMDGAGRLTLLVFVPLLAAILFCAYHIMPFYYYYFELQEHFASVVKVANVYSDKEIRDKIRIHLQRMEIPAKVEAVRIDRVGSRIKISLDYQEVFFVTFRGKDYDIHTFPFHAEAGGDL